MNPYEILLLIPDYLLNLRIPFHELIGTVKGGMQSFVSISRETVIFAVTIIYSNKAKRAPLGTPFVF